MVVDLSVENPFHITVFDKDFDRLGWVDAPISQTWHVRHNQQDSGQIIVLAGSDQDLLLSGKGKRVVVEYDGEFLMSGPVRSVRTEGFANTKLSTYEVQGDFRLLSRILLWPSPDRDEWDQTREHHRRTGTAEHVLRSYLVDAVERLEEDDIISFTTAQSRGGQVTFNARMVTPAEDLLALVDQAGLGVRVRQHPNNTGLRVEFYEGSTWPIVLSEDAGTLVAGSYSYEGPECTRVVIGGAFEGVERDFFTLENPAIEDEWGDVIEKFVDGGSVSGDYSSAWKSWDRAYERLLEEQQDRAAAARALQKAERGLRNAAQRLARALSISQAHPNSNRAQKRYNKALSAYNSAESTRNSAATTLNSTGNAASDAAIAGINARAELISTYIEYRDDIAELGVTELAKGVAKAGMSLTLQEGEVFRYGGANGFHVGDIVSIEIDDERTITDVLRTVTLSLSTDAGFTVTPQVGEREGDPTTKLTKVVGSAIKNQTRMRTR